MFGGFEKCWISQGTSLRQTVTSLRVEALVTSPEEGSQKLEALEDWKELMLLSEH